MLVGGIFNPDFVSIKPISYGSRNLLRIKAAAGGIGQYGLGAVVARKNDETADITENV